MIRLVEMRDYGKVCKLIDTFHGTTPYCGKTFIDEEKFQIMFRRCFANEETYTILLAEKDDEIVGILGAVKCEFPLHYETMTTELIWYIKPEHRGSKLALQLLKSYEYWSKEIAKADFCQMSCLPDLDLTKLYKRFGYEKMETIFMKENK